MSVDATSLIPLVNGSYYQPGAPVCPRGHVVAEGARHCPTCDGLDPRAASMSDPTIPIVRVGAPDLSLPRYETAGAAGFDLRADLSRMSDDRIVGTNPPHIVLCHGERALIPCGFAFEIPAGCEGQVRGRSLLTKRGILCPTGTIDSDYRGEVMTYVWNLSGASIAIEHGERVAQMIVAPAPQYPLVPSDSLSSTERGTGGFGSTGVK